MFLALHSPSSLRVGWVVIDGDKIEIVATDRKKGARLDDDGLFVQDPMAVMSLHGHELWMAGKDHKIDLWLDETSASGTTQTAGSLMFAMESLHGDSGFQTAVGDHAVTTVWHGDPARASSFRRSPRLPLRHRHRPPPPSNAVKSMPF